MEARRRLEVDAMLATVDDGNAPGATTAFVLGHVGRKSSDPLAEFIVARDRRVVMDQKRPVGRNRLDHPPHGRESGVERQDTGVQGRIDALAELRHEGRVPGRQDLEAVRRRHSAVLSSPVRPGQRDGCTISQQGHASW